MHEVHEVRVTRGPKDLLGSKHKLQSKACIRSKLVRRKGTELMLAGGNDSFGNV